MAMIQLTPAERKEKRGDAHHLDPVVMIGAEGLTSAVLKEADERNVSTFGNAWHSDFSFLEEPPMGSVLYAREVPTFGGDTLFANMYDAYDALSEGMRRMLDVSHPSHRARLEQEGFEASRSLARR